MRCFLEKFWATKPGLNIRPDLELKATTQLKWFALCSTHLTKSHVAWSFFLKKKVVSTHNNYICNLVLPPSKKKQTVGLRANV